MKRPQRRQRDERGKRDKREKKPSKAELAKIERPIREDLVRAAALECLGAILQERHLADRVLERVLRRESRLYSNERRAVAERVYAVLRRKGTLDFAIERAGITGITLGERDAIRLAGARLLEGEPRERIEQSAGIRVGERRVLEVLGNLPSELAKLDPLARLMAQGSVPKFLAELLLREMDFDSAAALLASLNTRAPLTGRTNLLKTTREKLIAELAAQEVKAEPGKFSPWAVHLETRVNAFSLKAFQAGHFELQDEGSQLLALVTGAKPGEQVVDACAGAGGKSLALAAMMRNTGELHALDVDAPRLEELKPRARRAGVSIIRSRKIPGDALAEVALNDLVGRADRVLVDAPCSGLGALRRNPDARWRLQPDELQKFAALQRTLLERFARLVKPGGLLVYATCSFSRLENEDVVAAPPPTFDPLPISELLGPLASSLGVTQYLRLWPHVHGTDGFFAAAFRRRS